MAGDSVVVKTRKFTKNPLLSRRQVRFYCEDAQWAFDTARAISLIWSQHINIFRAP